MTRFFLGWVCLLVAMGGASATAAEATIAVATNFRPVAEQIRLQLQRDTGHRYRLVSGATGKLYAQITSGAPFDVFLAADMERPERLVADGAVSGDGVSVYAVGQLALWIPGSPSVPALSDLDARPRIALANPRLAPYGAAAQRVLESTGQWQRLQAHFVFGDNIGLAHALVASGHAQAGFVALSTLLAAGAPANEYRVIEPSPDAAIAQGMVLLRRGQGNPAARAWVDWFRSAEALPLLRNMGYRGPPAVTG